MADVFFAVKPLNRASMLCQEKIIQRSFLPERNGQDFPVLEGLYVMISPILSDDTGESVQIIWARGTEFTAPMLVDSKVDPLPVRGDQDPAL